MKLSEVVAPGNKPVRAESKVISPFIHFVRPYRVIYIPKTKNYLCLYAILPLFDSPTGKVLHDVIALSTKNSPKLN